jgi:hypothetical protein
VDENAAVQALCVPGQTGHQSYRIRNLSGATPYIAFASPSVSGAGTPTMAKPVAPTSGTPSGNQAQGTIGMQSLGVEVFSLPIGCWFLAAAGATFEVQPGDGQ